MFDPYHKVWRLVWKNYFLEKISKEKGYITECLIRKNLLDSYNDFARLQSKNFGSFEEVFYTWAERYFPEYFIEAIDLLKEEIPNSDYFLSGSSNEMMQNVNFLFKKVKEIDGEPLVIEILMSNLQIRDVLDYYTNLNQEEYSYVVDVVKKLYEKFSNVRRLSNGGFIKCLIFCERFINRNPNLIWEDFLKMLFLLEDKLGKIVDILDPVKASIIRREKEDTDAKIRELIYTVDVNINCPIELKSFRQQYDYVEHFNKNGHPKLNDIRNSYTLRDYQVELITFAVRGQNVIIMAPTGSGKTLCAVEIMRLHMLENSSKGKGYRSLFIAPTGPLVLQQFQVLKNYLSDLYTVTTLSKNASEDEDVLMKILAHDVIVCTPQLFINQLMSSKESQKLYFSDFTLIVFDECHHCNSSHPYKQIMNLFHRAEGDYEKPQIVGLTASIGTGKKNTHEGCFNFYLEMAINLAAKRICGVYKNRETLNKVMKLPVDEIIEFDVYQNELIKYLNETTQFIVNELLKIDGASDLREHLKNHPIGGVEKAGFFPQILKLSTFKAFVKNSEVLQWIDNAVKAFTHIYLVREASQILPILYVTLYCVDYLENVNSVMRHSTSRDILVGYLMDMKNRISDEIGRNRSSFKPPPIYEKLLKICNDQIKKLPNSRIIIFVPTRFVATTLCDSIVRISKVKGSNMRPGYIIANGNTRMTKQSPAEQKLTLDDFRSGNVNIIIATTIAEEGLDIEECNLVIKYNVGGNEKSLIQRRGRARAQNAKSILLTCNNTFTSAEITNIQKERIMAEISEKINSMSISKFTKEIELKKIEMKKIADAKYENEIERRQKLYGKVYKVCCRNCKEIITLSHTIRRFNTHHVVLDLEIFDKISIDTGRMANTVSYFSVVADGICKKCWYVNEDGSVEKTKIGEIIHIDDHFYFKIILRNISFINNIDGDMYEERTKWDAVGNTLFLVPNASFDEIADYNLNFEKVTNKYYVKLMECKEDLRIQNNNITIWKKMEEKELKQLEKLMV
uniref:RNA helicase n=1 Tax=Strongyloides venezuelensis TaxID=75913 RepID=A0A0K0FMH5_STRVS